MHKRPGKGHTRESAETAVTKVTILSLPRAATAVGDLRAGRGGGWPGPGSAVLVAGPDAVAVGELVGALRAAGVPAAGWVGEPADPAVGEMAAELFPGCEVVTGG
jgi:hypothetical protein